MAGRITLMLAVFHGLAPEATHNRPLRRLTLEVTARRSVGSSTTHVRFGNIPL